MQFSSIHIFATKNRVSNAELGVVDWSSGVFASCMPPVQLYVKACSGWPHFALQHHWLLPINCRFLRLYSAAGRGTAAVSSAIEESDLYLFYLYSIFLLIGWCRSFHLNGLKIYQNGRIWQDFKHLEAN